MDSTPRFQQVLSIGADCQPAFQIEHALGETHGVFDWLVTPIDSFLAVLEDGGKRLATNFIAPPGGFTAVCGSYGLLYHHEFVNTPEGGVNFSLEVCQNIRDKFVHKMNRFDAACRNGASTLFVRRKIAADITGDRFNQQTFTAADANRLVEGIARRYPELDFGVLLALTEKDAGRVDLAGELDPRLIVTHVPRGSDNLRIGPDDWWEECFRELGVADLGSGQIQPASTAV